MNESIPRRFKENEHAFCIRGTAFLPHNRCASNEWVATYRHADKDDRFPVATRPKTNRAPFSAIARSNRRDLACPYFGLGYWFRQAIVKLGYRIGSGETVREDEVAEMREE